MKKPQYITLLAAAALIIVLYLFGNTTAPAGQAAAMPPAQQAAANTPHAHAAESAIAIDTLIGIAKKSLTPALLSQENQLEKNIKSPDQKQQLAAYHALSHFWKESGKSFIPFAWYSAEAARLENSEKNLTFAGQLFLDQLQMEENEELRKWMALQSKDLFERSLQLNPANDSSKVGLGASYLYGGIGTPMEGIGKIREVVAKDSSNVYAQMTLASASMMSGQTDKAVQRLETVLQLEPENLQALLMYGDIAEKQGDKAKAGMLYARAVKLVKRADLKQALEKRIGELKN